MNGRDSRALNWLQTWWGLLAMVLLIILILLFIWRLIPKPKNEETYGGPQPPSRAVAECRQQLNASTFNIPGATAHERYLTDYPVPTSKRPLYVYVEFKKSSYSFGGPAATPLTADNLRLTAFRPSDLDHMTNMSAQGKCSRVIKEPSTTADGSYSDERWWAYCDLTEYQQESQEQSTGLMKYRVRVENWSDEAVDYCFVASCDVRYPSGKPCAAPAGAGSPYSAPGGGGYSAPPGYSPPPGYSSPTASAAPATVTVAGQ